MLSSEPGHSVSHPEAWYQTKTKRLALLLSNRCVFVVQAYHKILKVHKKSSAVGEAVLQRHTWYLLTEELISLSLFDTKVPDETLNVLAQKMALPKIRSSSMIPDFVEPRSTVLFKALGLHTLSWLYQTGGINRNTIT